MMTESLVGFPSKPWTTPTKTSIEVSMSADTMYPSVCVCVCACGGQREERERAVIRVGYTDDLQRLGTCLHGVARIS